MINELDTGSNDIELIKAGHIDAIIKEIQGYFNMFNAVVDQYPLVPIDETDIRFIQDYCGDASNVRKGFSEAIAHFRAVYEIRKLIDRLDDNNEFVDPRYRVTYYKYLHNECRDALIMALYNMNKKNPG